VHPATVLRLVAAAPEPEVTAAPEVLGAGDFALAKGQVYGTVLVDMRTADVIDLLPDREAATLEAWLKAHPGAGVICRDRAGNYAEGARAGAPDAIQVADRWHLWHNLAEYAEKTVAGHRGCLKDQPGGGAPGPGDTLEQEPPVRAEGTQVPPDGFLDACGRERRLVARTRERYADIRQRLDAGESLSAISRVTGLDRKTVQRFARAGSAEELLGKATSRESKLDQFIPYLHQRWNEGVTDAAALHAELREQGWAGSEQTVRRYVRPFRQAPAAPGPAPAVPKTRQITRWLLTRPDHLNEDEQTQLQAIRARCPHIVALAGHVTAFAEMMTARTGSRDLEAWLAAVEADDQAGLRSFAAGIRKDQQAVTNGLSLHWNSGRVEGTVNIKDGQTPDVRPCQLRPAPQTRHLAPCVTRSQNSRQSPLNPHGLLIPGMGIVARARPPAVTSVFSFLASSFPAVVPGDRPDSGKAATRTERTNHGPFGRMARVASSTPAVRRSGRR
jgi:transposase